jgi:glycosyltransferase involved in cell wall biosynthesis
MPNKLFQLTTRLFAFPSLGSQKDLDLVFSPHFHGLASAKIPRIITMHDISFLHYPQFFSLKQRLWHWWQDYALQAKSAKHIIAVSEYTKSDLIKYLNIPEKNISVIYSGIGPEFKKIPQNDPELTNYQLTNGLTNPFFLFVGTLEPRKNLPTLIKAFALFKQNPKFSEYNLVIAGKPGYKAELIHETAKKSCVEADIKFFENVLDCERPLLYNLATAFVFPSWFEGFGFPPLEAQACGTPVIASDRTSIPEILGDSAIYFSPWNISELAGKMEIIATDKILRQNLIEKGQGNVKKFTWERTVNELNIVFENKV